MTVLDNLAAVATPASDESVAPAYQAWMAGHTDALEAFLTHDAVCVAMLDDPWSVSGLRAAITMARSRIPDHCAVLAPENRALIDRLGRYVGEVFVRCFDGYWCNVLETAPPGVEVWPMIRCRGYLAGISPRCVVEIALVEGRPGGPAATASGIVPELFASVKAKHQAWAS